MLKAKPDRANTHKNKAAYLYNHVAAYALVDCVCEERWGAAKQVGGSAVHDRWVLACVHDCYVTTPLTPHIWNSFMHQGFRGRKCCCVAVQQWSCVKIPQKRLGVHQEDKKTTHTNSQEQWLDRDPNAEQHEECCSEIDHHSTLQHDADLLVVSSTIRLAAEGFHATGKAHHHRQARDVVQRVGHKTGSEDLGAQAGADRGGVDDTDGHH